MSDCALGPDGKLLNASEITWYHDKDDDTPLPSSTGASRPSRRHIPSSRLTLDYSEAPQLKSHQAAIRAEEERLASLAKRNADEASLSDQTSSPATADSSEDDQLKPAIQKGLPVFLFISDLNQYIPVTGKRARVASTSGSVDGDGFLKDVQVTPIDSEPEKIRQRDRTRDINQFFAPAHERDGKKYRTCLRCRCTLFVLHKDIN